MAAASLNITIDQGATFLRTLTFKDTNGVLIDLTDWTFTSELKSSIGRTLLGNFTFVVLDQTAHKGQVTMNMSASVTTSLVAGSATIGKSVLIGAYDVKATLTSGVVYRVLMGSASISREVTTE